MSLTGRLTAASVALVLTISVASACDDFADEMAMAAAVNAAKQARVEPMRPQAGEAVAAAPAEPAPAQVAAGIEQAATSPR